MILSVSHLTKSFLDRTILQDASFHLEEKEKAAIVGINGAGKTTLMRLIMGDLMPDEGSIAFKKGTTVGYLAQHQDLILSGTIFEALMEVKKDIIKLEQRIRILELEMQGKQGEELERLMKEYASCNHIFEENNGYGFRSEVTGILKGLGFAKEEFTRPVAELSGGQKTRVSLGRLLLTKPDLILLDEPTNHLDLSSISWLESFLSNYPGSVLLISHDRYFIDRVAAQIIEVENTRVTSYKGNYSAYVEKSEMIKKAALKQYENQQAEIKHQQEVIRKLKSFNREKSIKRAESREKMLEKIEVLDKPKELHDTMSLTFVPSITSGNDVLSIKGLAKSYPAHDLFVNMNIEIKRGEKIAIIGDNGTGKTTLLKIINGLVPQDRGTITAGTNVHIGYYDQEHHVLHREKTLLDEIQDTYPQMDNTRIRNMLAAFLFIGDDVFKQVSELSGGERGRLSLAKLMLSKANFLILDEPTNHLDMVSKEVLEKAVKQYEGTVLYVSHDRYFINKTATRILELYQHQFIDYAGSFEYYMDKQELMQKLSRENAPISAGPDTGSSNSKQGQGFADEIELEDSAAKLDWKANKEAQAAERKRRNDLQKTEERIALLEERNQQIEQEMSKNDVATNVSRLMELTKEKENNDSRLEELYEKWGALSEE